MRDGCIHMHVKLTRSLTFELIYHYYYHMFFYQTLTSAVQLQLQQKTNVMQMLLALIPQEHTTALANQNTSGMVLTVKVNKTSLTK